MVSKSKINLKKKLLCAALSAAFILSATGCGKTEADEVTDYGVNTAATAVTEEAGASDNGTTTDAAPSSNDMTNGGTLKEQFGDRVEWKESIAVQGIEASIDFQEEMPDDYEMNVYYTKRPDDSAESEEAMVKALFGDTAEKLESVSYTTQTENMSLLYKYRDILSDIEGTEPQYSVITSSFTDKYTWADEAYYYIHMYKGKYNDMDYALLLAYDYNKSRKYIFFEPTDVNQYFPDGNYKTMMLEAANDTAGNILDVDNACDLSVDELMDQAKSFAGEKLLLSDAINKWVDYDDFRYSILTSGILYGLDSLDPYSVSRTLYSKAKGVWSMEDDSGLSMLSFSDSDYVSTMYATADKYGFRDYEILGEQNDLVTDGMEQYKMGYWDYLSLGVSGREENPTVVRDGYALYLGNEMGSGGVESIGDYNYGVIEITSKGIYGADIILSYEVTDKSENVGLLKFDQMKDCIKTALDDLDLEKLDNPTSIQLLGLYMTYAKVEKEGSDEADFVPAWAFSVLPGTGYSYATNTYADVVINAMDGSLISKECYKIGE